MPIHGSPLPSTFIPTGSLPIMPLSINVGNNEHPHPLRSHDIMAQHESTAMPRYPSPLIISRSGGIGERGRRPSIRTVGNCTNPIDAGRRDQQVTTVTTQPHSSEARLGNTVSTSAPSTADYPVVPVRPPLRPTISFGGVSKLSMYSDESSIYHHKAATVTVTSFDEDDEGPTPKKGNGRGRFYVCYACICLANFMCDVSLTVIALVLPTVSKDLRLTAVQTLWIPGSLMFSAALAQPLFMRLSLALGCKSMLLFGLGIFTIGNVVSGLSQNATNMLVGTSLAGTGVGIVSVLTKLTLGQISPSPPSMLRMMVEKPASQVFWLGIALGPLIGKCLLDTVGWRSIFWMQIHFSLIAFVGLAPCLRLPHVAAGSVWQSLAKVDVAGWVLLSASVAPITVAISLAGSTYSWTSHQVLLAVVFGSIAFGLWCAYTRFWRVENPLLPLSIFRNGSAVVAALGALAQGAIIMTLIYFLPIFWQASQAGLSSLSLTPWTFALAILGLAAATVTSHTGYRSLIWAGWALVTLSTGLAVLFNAVTPTTFFIPVGLLGGTGLGLLLPTLNTALSATASNDDESIHAAPLHTFAWTLGASVGVSISSSIFLNGLSLPQPLQTQNIFYLIGDLTAMPPYQAALKAELIDAIVSSTRTLWIAGCIVSGIVFLLSFWFLEDHMPQPRTMELD